jgi:hypothetical protein
VHRLRREPIPVPDALHKLRAIAAAPPPIHPLARIAGYMLMALGFAMCFRMSPLASVAAVVLSIPIAAVLLWSGTKPAITVLMPVLLTFLAALPIALWSVHGGFDDPVRLAVIPVVTLIPGAALTTALIELTTGDMIAGSTRLVSALIVLLSMAFGFALALDVAGLTSVHLQDLTSEQAPSWVLWLAGPVFAVGNILYFCTPQRLWVWTIGLNIRDLLAQQRDTAGHAARVRRRYRVGRHPACRLGRQRPRQGTSERPGDVPAAVLVDGSGIDGFRRDQLSHHRRSRTLRSRDECRPVPAEYGHLHDDRHRSGAPGDPAAELVAATAVAPRRDAVLLAEMGGVAPRFAGRTQILWETMLSASQPAS